MVFGVPRKCKNGDFVWDILTKTEFSNVWLFGAVLEGLGAVLGGLGSIFGRLGAVLGNGSGEVLTSWSVLGSLSEAILCVLFIFNCFLSDFGSFLRWFCN